MPYTAIGSFGISVLMNVNLSIRGDDNLDALRSAMEGLHDDGLDPSHYVFPKVLVAPFSVCKRDSQTRLSRADTTAGCQLLFHDIVAMAMSIAGDLVADSFPPFPLSESGSIQRGNGTGPGWR